MELTIIRFIEIIFKYSSSLFSKIAFRLSSDEIEREGVRRAVTRSQEADLIILMVDITEVLQGEGLLQDRVRSCVDNLLKKYLRVSETFKALFPV